MTEPREMTIHEVINKAQREAAHAVRKAMEEYKRKKYMYEQRRSILPKSRKWV